MSKQQKLVNFGNVTIDDVIKYDGTIQMGCLGGDVIYATAASRFFIDNVCMIAPIGNDYPATNMDLLHSLGISTKRLIVRNVPTHRNWVIYEDDGRRFWINRTDSKNIFTLSPLYSDIPTDSMDADGYLILAMDLAAQEDLVNGLRNSGRFIVLDPQEDYITGNEDRLMKIIGKVDIFMPSEIEVLRLLGHNDLDRAADEFYNAGCKKTVIKLGANGCFLYDKEHGIKENIPCYKTKAVDTTGAGDSFCGGFTAEYIQSRNMIQAAIAGTIAASFAVEDFSFQRLMSTTREQVEERIIEFVSKNNLGKYKI